MSGQDPLKRDSLLFINGGEANQLGDANRDSNTQNYVGNYFLRLGWTTLDRFRGVQGAFVAPSSVGGTIPVNVAADSPNAPLYSTPTAPETISFDTTTSQRQEIGHYLLEPNNAIWNAADTGPIFGLGNTRNMLRKWIQDPDVYEGDPYYSYFLELGIPTAAGSGAPPAIPAVFNRPGVGGAFVDHTFAYLKPPESLADRSEGGLEITITPVYNFYLDTMPPFEQITSNVPEAILPNFYIFETELRNTGSQTYSIDYHKALTFFSGPQNHDRMDDWFVETAPGSYTETSTKSYYQSYVSSLATIKSSESNYNSLKTQYNTSLKNIAVLHSDIEAIYRTNRVNTTVFGDQITSGLSFLPYYNIITVGEDQYRAVEETGLGTTDLPTEEDSFFGSLFTVPAFDAESFIDLLQMYIITFLEKESSAPDAQFHAFSRTENPSQTLVSASLYFDLSRRDAGAGLLPGVPAPYNEGFEAYAPFLADRITENNSQMDDFVVDDPNTSANPYWERDNVMLIRDYSNDAGWESNGLNAPRVYNPPDPTAVAVFYEKIENEEIVLPMRGFEDVLMNQGAFSETILYKIDKRVVDSAGNILPDVVQTIYLSPKFAGSGPLQYIDSQVRYGVRYQYDIKQVRVVFGNQYYYDDLQLYYAGYAGYGRAVGNALGFYQPMMQNIVVDDYVIAHVRDYYPNTEDTDFAPTHNGYFAVAPSNETEVDVEQWAYMAQGSLFDEAHPRKTDRVNLIIKRGFGFDGNPFGGAMTGEYNAPYLGSPIGQFEQVAGEVGDIVFNVPPFAPAAAGGPAPASSDEIPGVEEILAYEEMATMMGTVETYVADKLIAGALGVGGMSGLPPGVGEVVEGVLGNLAEIGGVGVVGAVGPFDGGASQEIGGFGLSGEMSFDMDLGDVGDISVPSFFFEP